MRTLLSRLTSQLESQGTIFYESPGGQISKEMELAERPKAYKSYINPNVPISISSATRSPGTPVYYRTAKKPKGCPVNCESCLECPTPKEIGCNYDGIY